jgi:hypothetical protein
MRRLVLRRLSRAGSGGEAGSGLPLAGRRRETNGARKGGSGGVFRGPEGRATKGTPAPEPWIALFEPERAKTRPQPDFFC